MIKEEQYGSNINAGTFRTKEEAQAYLAYIRQKYGFDETNSYVNGTTVVVTIEKSVTDDSYYYDIADAIKGEKANRVNQYKMVSESRKNDKGETVPEKCDKCGGKVCVQIHGEPVFVCEKCGKHFGTMPCNIKEGKMKKKIVLNESQLRQVISEAITELIYGKKDNYDSFEEEFEDLAYGTLDYLHNEGVIDYDENHIHAYAEDIKSPVSKIVIPYDDIIKTTCYCYQSQMSDYVKEIIAAYKKYGDTDEDVRGSIDKAILRYDKDCNQGFGM